MAPPVKAGSRSAMLKSALLKKKASPNLSAWGRFELALDEYFSMTARGTDLTTELRAGTTAFLASANNFVVNAHIMQHAGIDPGVSVVSGAFSTAIVCVLSGLLSNLPLGCFPSVGPNVFLAFSLVAKGVVDTDGALGISGACGAMLFLLSLTPVLKLVLGLVPLSIKYGLIMGTGLLTALIGLKSIGIVVPDTGPSQDIVALGELADRKVVVASVFLIIMASMLHNGVKGAVLLGMLGATFCDWALTGDWPAELVAVKGLTPHHVDVNILNSFNGWVQVGALMLMLLFSISGAVIGSARMAGLLRHDGSVPGSTAVYLVCGLGTVISASLGCAPIFVSMSSAAGIRDGGRTGLMSIVIGFWSLLTAFFFSPVAADIPACAVAPVLILVGVSMIGEAKEVPWWSMQEALPAFLCAVFQPFTYSVANGIYAGLFMSFILFFSTGSFLTYLPSYQHEQKVVQTNSAASAASASSSTRAGQLRALRSRSRALDRKHSLETLETVYSVRETPDPSSAAAAGGSPTPTPAPKFAKLPSRFSVSFAEEDDGEEASAENGLLRGRVAGVGKAARMKAMALITQAAETLGLDADEISKLAEERLLSGGRNAEAHAIGGIAGSEAELAREVIHASAGDLSILAAAEAPALAAAARRARYHRSANQLANEDQAESLDALVEKL